MQSRLKMSDYEKIIFVDNIDENELKRSGGSIEELSSSYPFAVFFTNYKGENGETQNQTVHNIWQGGNRLTKFVGIDPNKNKIRINSHILKLSFYYDTGLLGIEDANQLESIRLVDVSFTELDGNTYNSYVQGMETIINAIDNKFTLVFEFTFKGIPDNEANVTNISPSLNITSSTDQNYFRIISIPELLSVSNDKKTARYAYNCIVDYDTDYLTLNEGNIYYTYYNAISQYDDNVSSEIKLRLKLNPTDYDIFDNNGNIINNNASIILPEGVSRIFSISLEPSKNDLYSYPSTYKNSISGRYLGRKLYLTVVSDNPTYVTVENSRSADIEINLDKVNFKITTSNVGINTSASSTITLSLKCVENNHETVYNLSRQFRISLTGDSVTSMFYCGYDNPLDSDFNPSKLVDISGRIDNDSYPILYDWETASLADDTSKYFYIAYPQSLENRIKICWDAFTVNSNNEKIYTPITNRFDKQSETVTLLGITFNVYKCKDAFKGLFYGKIQYQ